MMALAKIVLNTGHLLRKSGTHSITPLAALRTSAVTNKIEEEPKWHWWKWLIPVKPEYDEKGELGFPDEDDMAPPGQGVWGREVEAYRSGIKDPYDILPYWYAEGKYDGTKLDPIMVPSAQPSRMLLCKCEPEATHMTAMWLHQNEPARCSCGFWFLLYYKEPFIKYDMPW